MPHPPEPPPTSSSTRPTTSGDRAPRANLALSVVVGALALGTALSWGGGLWWVLDLLVHFHLHALIAAALCLAYAVALRAPRRAALAVGLALLHAWPLWQHGGGSAPAAVGAERWTVAVINVNQDFGHKGHVLTWLEQIEADAVVLVEVDPRWLAALGSVGGKYLHRADLPRTDRFGLAILSRHPLGAVRRWQPVPAGPPVLAAEVASPLGPVRLVAVHTPPPVSAHHSAQRDALVAALATALEPEAVPESPATATPAALSVVLAGDFNTTPWSAAVAPLVAAGFEHGRRGQGLQPSWPSALGAFGIPIDHLWVRGGLAVARHRLGPDVGSDHLPLVVELGRAPAP